MYFPKTSLVKPYLEKTNQNNRDRLTIRHQLQVDCSRIEDVEAPQVHDVVLVVAPVQVHVVGVDQQEAEQDEQDLHGAFPAIHKVSVEDVRLLGGREAVLRRRRLMRERQQEYPATCGLSRCHGYLIEDHQQVFKVSV